jgi:hypothetical protein
MHRQFFKKFVMFIFFDIFYKSITVFVDDFSTQSDANSHLGCMREKLKMCRTTILVLNPEKTYLML